MRKSAGIQTRGLIDQAIKLLIEENSSDEDTFLAHIEGWVDMFLDIVLKITKINTYNVNHNDFTHFIEAVNRDVEDNNWLEHDLGEHASKNPGAYILRILSHAIDVGTIYNRDHTLRKLIHTFPANDESLTTRIYLKTPPDTSTRAETRIRLKNALVKYLHELIPHTRDVYVKSDESEKFRTRFFTREILKSMFDQLLQWCHRGRYIHTWKIDTSDISLNRFVDNIAYANNIDLNDVIYPRHLYLTLTEIMKNIVTNALLIAGLVKDDGSDEITLPVTQHQLSISVLRDTDTYRIWQQIAHLFVIDLEAAKESRSQISYDATQEFNRIYWKSHAANRLYLTDVTDNRNFVKLVDIPEDHVLDVIVNISFQ